MSIPTPSWKKNDPSSAPYWGLSACRQYESVLFPQDREASFVHLHQHPENVQKITKLPPGGMTEGLIFFSGDSRRVSLLGHWFVTNPFFFV